MKPQPFAVVSSPPHGITPADRETDQRANTGLILSLPGESAPDFLRRITGKPPRSAAEIAEAEARHARLRLEELIHAAEYTIARVQREKILREGMRDGETYAEWHQRLNDPFCKAADRTNERMAEFETRRAAA